MFFLFFLCSFSGPSEAYILAREDAIAVWRHLMGPTKVFKCQLSNPDTIRAKHGLTDTRNATHGSGNFVVFRLYEYYFVARLLAPTLVGQFVIKLN